MGHIYIKNKFSERPVILDKCLAITNEQLKEEIQKALDEVPETALEDILKYLKEVRSKSSDKVEMSRNLRKILNEDKALLDRLAQ